MSARRIVALVLGTAACGRYGFAVPEISSSVDAAADGAPMQYATPVIVQTADISGGSGTTTATVPILPTGGGNLLVVGVVDYTPGEPVIAITDDRGNAYVSAGALSSNVTGDTDVWYAANTLPGATSITVQLAASTVVLVWIIEASGMDPAAPLSTADTNSSGSSADPVVAPLVMPTTPSALVVSVIDITAPMTPDASSPFVNLPFHNYDDTAYVIATTPGAYGAAWHDQAGSIFSASTVAFKAAAR